MKSLKKDKEVRKIIEKYEEKLKKNMMKDNPDTHKKITQLSQTKLSLNGKNFLDKEDFQLLKYLAITEGGFIKNEFRKLFWSKIFSISHMDVIEKRQFRGVKFTKENTNLKMFKEIHENLRQSENSINDEEIIDKDVHRSIFNLCKLKFTSENR